MVKNTLTTILLFCFVFSASGWGATLAQEPLRWSDLTAQQKKDLADFQQKNLAEDYRAQPIYQEVFQICKNDKKFKSYVAGTRQFLANAGESFESSSQLLDSKYLAQIYGTHFLSYDIYSAIHSGGFYQAIKDCAGEDRYARDAMLFVFVGGDVFGRVAFIAFAVALFMVVKRLGWFAKGAQFFADFPLIKKVAMTGAGIYGSYEVYDKASEIYDIASPSRRRARSEALKAQEIDGDPDHLQTSQFIRGRIHQVENQISTEQRRLTQLPPNATEAQYLKNRIYSQKTDVLNLRMSLNFVQNEENRSFK